MLKAPDLNVITVIDPDEKTEVEIRPQEILQVVLVDRKAVNWNYQEQVSTIRLKALRHETYYNDEIERNRESNFQVVAHTKKYGALQHHFWFRLNPGDCKKIMEQPRGCHELVEIVFKDDSGKQIGKVSVWLLIEQEDKNSYYDLMEQTVWGGKDPIANEAQYEGLGNRVVDLDNGYILNPGWDEQVVFETNQRMMMVELAEPQHAKLKWQATGTHRPEHEGDSANFGITELVSRFINGVRVQRFLIKNHLHNLPVGVNKMRLGDVMFRIKDEYGHHPRWDKKINFSIVREREPDYYFGGEDDEGYNEEEAYRFLRQVETWCAPKRPRRSEVKIEELDIKGDLRAGAKLIKLYIPPPERKRTFEFVDPSDNAFIQCPVGEELVIHLYKNTMRPSEEWKCDSGWKMLKASYTITDFHRQRFVFEIDPKSKIDLETLVFNLNGRIKRLHIQRTGHKIVQEVNTNEVSDDDKDVEKVMSELLDNPTYDWRTVTSLHWETKVAQTKVVEILDKMSKAGKVVEHPTDAGLWGHKKRVGERVKEYCGDL